MNCFVVSFGRGLMLAEHPAWDPSALRRGWRPCIWTRKLERAEKFGNAAAAELFARGAVHHDRFEIVNVAGFAPGPGVSA
jgi:hypothetical protein